MDRSFSDMPRTESIRQSLKQYIKVMTIVKQ